MCLVVCEKATAEYLENRKDKGFVKVIKYLDFTATLERITEIGNPLSTFVVTKITITTPYQFSKVVAGWLKPERKYTFENPETIHGGAIHAYLTDRLVTPDLKSPELYFGDYLVSKIYPLKCWATNEDIIKVGNREDIALKRLYIPQREIDKYTKDLCEIVTKQCSSLKDSI